MGLIESIEEDEKKLIETEVVTEKEEEKQAEEAPKEDVAEPEQKEEEPKIKEDETKEEEKPNPSAFARLRREKAALEKQLRDLQATREEPAPADETPQETFQLPPEVLEVVEQQKIAKAGAEFTALEADFKKIAPDYDEVATQYKMALIQANRLKNPRATLEQIINITNKELLVKAGNYQIAGYDPIQELYEEAKALGYGVVQKDGPKEEKPRKADIDVVAKNMEKSAGMAGSKGRGSSPNITRESALTMPLSEFASMSASELEALERG